MNLQALSLGLYIHFPFCASICDYCVFHSEIPTAERLKYFLDTLKKEITLTNTLNRVDSVFWGGGTPTLLSCKELQAIGAELIEIMPNKPKEWTVEVNPSSINKEKLIILKELGVNRISIGVQSFSKNTLEKIGRKQNIADVYSSYQTIREVGIKNINLDLIFAVPGQSIKEWEYDLNEAIKLNPEHISTYCLIQKGQKNLTCADEKDFFTFTWEKLANTNLKQYEIANFAKEGYECLHNINTWLMNDWIGFGPSAASQYKNKRYRNPNSLLDWAKGSKEEIESLNEKKLFVDAIFFGLRMNEGVCLTYLKNRFNDISLDPILPVIKQLKEEGFLKNIDNKIILTPKGRLVADNIGQAFFELEDSIK